MDYQKLAEFKQFRKERAVRIDGIYYYKTKEDAQKAQQLQKAWWGDNLICLGIVENNGLYAPQFNLFD